MYRIAITKLYFYVCIGLSFVVKHQNFARNEILFHFLSHARDANGVTMDHNIIF